VRRQLTRSIFSAQLHRARNHRVTRINVDEIGSRLPAARARARRYVFRTVSAGFMTASSEKKKKKEKRRTKHQKKGKKKEDKEKRKRKRKILFFRVRRRVTGALIDNELSKIDGSFIERTGRNTFQRS